MDDIALVEQYRQGRIEALEELIEKYRRPLYSYILNMTGGRDDADDIFQEAWMRAIRNLDRFTHGSMLSWMMRITRNLTIDRARKRKPELSLDVELGDEAGTTHLDMLESGDPDPVASLASGDIAGEVWKAVAELPEEQREVFVMRVKSDMSFKEIAEAQDVSINTSLARMQYAIRKLRVLLEDRELL